MALMSRHKIGSKREPTIALINVVFLLLVFFLIAGTLAPPVDDRLTLVKAANLQETPPPDGVLILSDGTLLKDGNPASIQDAVVADSVVRIVPDRDLPAAMLLDISRQLRTAGAKSVIIVTELALGQ